MSHSDTETFEVLLLSHLTKFVPLEDRQHPNPKNMHIQLRKSQNLNQFCVLKKIGRKEWEL